MDKNTLKNTDNVDKYNANEKPNLADVATMDQFHFLSGYLNKERDSKWKKGWHQRWFVLNKKNGILNYYKYAHPSTHGLPRGTFHIRKSDVVLTIQGENEQGTPSPFCFKLSNVDKSIRMCAESENEFKQWINSLLVHIKQDFQRDFLDIKKIIHDNNPQKQNFFPLNKIKNSENEEKSKHLLQKQSWGALFSIQDGILGCGTLQLINPIAFLCRYGPWKVLLLMNIAINFVCIFYLWYYNDRQETLEANNESKKKLISMESTRKMAKNAEKVHRSRVNGKVNGCKPMAGSSVERCESDNQIRENGCWITIDASRFHVREGPNYRKTKKKASSKSSLLHLLAADIYQSKGKIDNIGSYMELSHLSDKPLDLFIINCQVPGYSPSNPLWGEKINNGIGFNLVLYFSIPDQIRADLNRPLSDITDPSVKLLKQFMYSSCSVRDRFKAIGIVVNPHDQKLGRTERHLLENYNGQPILTRPQHRFYEGENYFEVDIDAHEFNYIARKGLCEVSNHMINMIVDFGFVIQGEGDEELPERILGCIRLCKVNLRKAPFFE